MTNHRKHFVSAAIDFGTTYSGYAFSFLSDFKKDPLKIHAKNWSASSLMSFKTPTCVLFDPKGNFSKFGFEAEDKYSELTETDEHEQWYYFRRFKMELYGDKTINRNTEITEECEKKMTAMKVFSAGIKYLKDHMMDEFSNHLGGKGDDDFQWVVTVPAIWSDSAKQFMREAAEHAGIPKDQLIIALEPEAASLFCKNIAVTKSKDSGFETFKAGSNYMVLDAGGGTVDITIHEVQRDGTLREKHKANGGDWGGTKIDDAFKAFLSSIVGNNAFEKSCRKGKGDMLDLFREFEVKKRSVKPEGDDKINFKIPMVLSDCCMSENDKNMSDIVPTVEKLSGNVKVMGDKLRVPAGIARELYEETISHIIGHLKDLLDHPDANNVKTILMVGGFSESSILQNIIRQNFQNLEVINPQDAGLAVLKGAVIFGHEPEIIKSRVCKFTYGIKTSEDFKENTHPDEKRMVTSDGRVLCMDIFDIHVQEGHTVFVGDPQSTRNYSVIEPNQTAITFDVFTSKRQDPEYTSDEECLRLGSLCIDMLDTSRGLDRSADVQMTFGGTEITVEATDKNTGESVSASFDFLT